MEVAHSNGLDIAYDRFGNGPPVVFVHGAGDDHRIWQPQCDSLGDEFTVIAWDEPGAGHSSDLPEDFELADYANSLAAVISAATQSPAHVVGLSWGGVVVLELYRLHPELIASLILADTYAGWKGSLAPDEVRTRVAAIRESAGAPDFNLPGPFAGERPEQFVPMLAQMSESARPASLLAQLKLIAEADQSDLLPQIVVPTLLIWGEKDIRSPLSVARQFEREIPDASLVVVPGAGHLSNLERPESFNNALRGFCGAMELDGFEPSTSCMPCKRSTS